MTMRDPADSIDAFLELIQGEIQRRKKRSGQLRHDQPFSDEETVSIPSAERIKIQEALIQTGGNYTKAAAVLGISRVTLWRKLKAMNK